MPPTLEPTLEHLREVPECVDELNEVELGAASPSVREGMRLDRFKNVVSDLQRCGTLKSGRLRVIGSFEVKYSMEEGTFVAKAEEFGEVGYGQDRQQALLDLQRTLVELYLTLKDSADRLGPDLQETWKSLQQRFVLRS